METSVVTNLTSINGFYIVNNMEVMVKGQNSVIKTFFKYNIIY